MMVRGVTMEMDRSGKMQRDAGSRINRTCWWIENDTKVKLASQNIFQVSVL